MPYTSGSTATERSVTYKMPVPTSRYSSSASSYRSSYSDRPYYSSATGSYTRTSLPRSLASEYRSSYSTSSSRLTSRSSGLDDRSTTRDSSQSRYESSSLPSSGSRRVGASPSEPESRRANLAAIEADLYSKYSPANYVPNEARKPEAVRKSEAARKPEPRKEVAVGRSRAVGGCSSLERRMRSVDLGPEVNEPIVEQNENDNEMERQLSVSELRKKFVEKAGGADKCRDGGQNGQRDGGQNGQRDGEQNGQRDADDSRDEQPKRSDAEANGCRGKKSEPEVNGAGTGKDKSPSMTRKSYVEKDAAEISSSEEEEEDAAMDAKADDECAKMTSPALKRSVPINNISQSVRESPRINGRWTATAADDSDSEASTSSRPRAKKISESNGLTGLINIGNTCFMNSVVQCLSNTKPLLEYLLSDNFMAELNHNSAMKGKLILAFSEIIRELWSGAGVVVSPTTFKGQISRYAPRFTGYSQQDAQEFLRFLLEGVHEDVNRVKTKPRQLSDANDSHCSADQKAVEQWKRYLRQDDSKIVDLFVGQLRSTLRCSVCGHCSVTFDPFWDLQVPIPSRAGQLRLSQCLDHFTTEEVLDGNEKAFCAQCEKNQKSTKSFTIQKFPKILVLQLNRFSPTDRYRRKLSVTIDFPLDHLDLSNYAAVKSANCVYNLYGVSNHSGSPSFGHYTAYCKHPHTADWHEYNDSRVSSISARSVVSSEAYLLFYELSSRSSHL